MNTGYFLPRVETKDYNVMIDKQNLFDKPIKNDQITYHNIRKIETGQRDDYITGCLIDYLDFKEHYKLIAIDLSKQQKLDADSKSIQQINFTENLENSRTIFFIIEEAKETFLDFSKGAAKVLSVMILFCFDIILIQNDSI